MLRLPNLIPKLITWGREYMISRMLVNKRLYLHRILVKQFQVTKLSLYIAFRQSQSGAHSSPLFHSILIATLTDEIKQNN